MQSAQDRTTHRTLLRGLMVAILLCEAAATTGAVPGIVAGGLAGALSLPFFAPSLLGALAAQCLLRPHPRELAATLAVAAALVLPLANVLAGVEHGVAIAAASAAGLASLAVLGVAALWSTAAHWRDASTTEALHENATGLQENAAGLQENAAGLQENAARPRCAPAADVLAPALLLPCFTLLAWPMVFLTAALWPTTFDERLFLADAAFGAPLSFVVGSATAAVPGLPGLLLAVYVALPLALMLVHVLRTRDAPGSNDTLVAFVAVTVVGCVGYHLVPVAGPAYAFEGLFPSNPPDPSALSTARTLVLPMPRNCMPSLHSAWALLVWWNARPLSAGPRAAAAVFLGLTLLATVGLGFHYVVDLVAAFPLTMAAQAWSTRTRAAALRRAAVAGGLGTTLAWMAFVTWSDAMLATPPPLLWTAALGVVAGSSWLRARVAASGLEPATGGPAGSMPPQVGAIRSRVAASARSAAAFLVGGAVLLHHAIAANTLAPRLGADAVTRLGLLTASTLAFACGTGAVAALPRHGSRAAWRLGAGSAFAASTWAAASVVASLAMDPSQEHGAAALGPIAAALLLLPPVLAGALAGADMESTRGGPATSDGATDEAAPHAARTGAAAAWMTIGAGCASLATGAGILPSLHSRHLPSMIAVAALGLFLLAAMLPAARSAGTRRGAEDPPAGDANRGSAPHGHGPGSTALLVAYGVAGGALLSVTAGLFAALFGDTLYARGQAGAAVLLGLGAGVLASGRVTQDAGSACGQRRGNAEATALLAAGALAAVTWTTWNDVAPWLSTFAAYAERYGRMATFPEREFVRLATAVFFLTPTATALGAAVGAHLRTSTMPGGGLALVVAAGAAGTFAGPVLALPLFGSAALSKASASAFAAIGAARAVARRAGLAAAAAVTATILALPGHDPSAFSTSSGLVFAPEAPSTVLLAAESPGSFAVARRDERGRESILANGIVRGGHPLFDAAMLAEGAAPRRALLLGIGSGETLGALLRAGSGEVTVAEPDGALLALAGARSLDAQAVRPRVLPMDGRRALALDAAGFDFVAVEDAGVVAAGSAWNATREFHRLAASRLADGGVLARRLDLAGLSPMGLASILGAARPAFGELGLHFSTATGSAVLVACRGRCAVSDAPIRAFGDAMLDDDGVGRFLDTMAAHLGVPPSALGAADRDLFLALEAPAMFAAPPGASAADLLRPRIRGQDAIEGGAPVPPPAADGAGNPSTSLVVPTS